MLIGPDKAALGASVGILALAPLLAGCGSSHRGSAQAAADVVTASTSTQITSQTISTSTRSASASTQTTSAQTTQSGSGAAGKGQASQGASAPSASTGIPYEVSTSSMEPTFEPETTIYYDPTRTSPKIGDVIVFYLPVGANGGSCGTVMTDGHACAKPRPGLTRTLALKRVVGLPGDTIAIREGKVIRNGKPEKEPPTLPCGPQEKVGCEFPNPIRVPPGHYYVMSDHRGLAQEDSRVFGAIPQAAVMGTVEGR